MSGICGIVDWRGGTPEDAIRLMAEAAPHRSIDGTGYRITRQVQLATLRHWLTPESKGEMQPLFDPDSGLTIAADARIDNRLELVDGLKDHGFDARKGSSDAALILSAYACWGLEAPRRLLGDFAFAVWDSRKRRLFAARDAMGMRAFYFREEPHRLLLATEIKQILALPDVPAEIQNAAVGSYLAGSFEPLDETFYEGIRQLPPAYALLAEEGRVRLWRYWDIDPEKKIRYRKEEEYAEHFLELFLGAVQSRLRSRRAVGISLSGGVDSGSIASAAGRLFQQGKASCPTLRAFSFAFDELKECDERWISDGIARHFQIPVTDVRVEEAWPLKDFPAHGPDRDEPFIGAYQATIEHMLARARAEGIGILLSGDRGDLVAGCGIYDFLGLLAAGSWGRLFAELQRQALQRNISLWKSMKRSLLLPLPSVLWPEWQLPALRRSLRSRLRSSGRPDHPPWLRRDFMQQIGRERAGVSDLATPPWRSLARRWRYRFIFTPLHMRGVLWSERTQARFGIGFADPWSDRRVAEFSLAVPQSVLNRGGDEKRLVKLSMKGLMPERERRLVRKTVPTPFYRRALTQWSRPAVEDLLTDMEADKRGYVQEEELRRHYRSVLEGQIDHPCFWWALTLEMWLREYWAAGRAEAVSPGEGKERPLWVEFAES